MTYILFRKYIRAMPAIEHPLLKKGGFRTGSGRAFLKNSRARAGSGRVGSGLLIPADLIYIQNTSPIFTSPQPCVRSPEPKTRVFVTAESEKTTRHTHEPWKWNRTTQSAWLTTLFLLRACRARDNTARLRLCCLPAASRRLREISLFNVTRSNFTLRLSRRECAHDIIVRTCSLA